MSSFSDFQILLDQQVGTLPKRSSWPAAPGNVMNHLLPRKTHAKSGHSPDERITKNKIEKPKKQRPVPMSSLRLQGAAWATAGGSMLATLHGVQRIFRNFRGLKYI